MDNNARITLIKGRFGFAVLAIECDDEEIMRAVKSALSVHEIKTVDSRHMSIPSQVS